MVLNNIKYGFITLFIAASALSADAQTANENEGFAVVELFTSEGCGSSPEAEKLLPKLETEYGDRLYTLQYHVDYHDKEGWKDEFSNPEFTARQEKYGALLGVKPIYTPQAVVNGTVNVLGFEQKDLSNLIEKELRKAENEPITLSAKREGGDIVVKYETSLESNEVLNIALVQLYAANEVTTGANAGKKLEHTNVVRELRVVNTARGEGRFALPKAVDLTNYHIVAYKQNDDIMAISGVAEVPIK
ncbi:MAG TPA: DUF1223 domain-containing protein [Flavipsychrobacter sp.]